MADAETGELARVDPSQVTKNPNNPRRYFNEGQLDLLRSSIQESGVLVPLIVYRSQPKADRFVLMDGERRWRSALELRLKWVPVNIIPKPTPLQNLLHMFNIHGVREDWPLISIALALRDVMKESGETGEKRLAEMTGLSRAAVRRAKRLLSLPEGELDLIQEEAHLDRNEQVHREDLYLEIEAAESVLRNAFTEIATEYPREEIIRQFARKRETGSLIAVTDFRHVGKLVKAAKDPSVEQQTVLNAARRLIEDTQLNPKDVFEAVGSSAYQQLTLARRAELFAASLATLRDDDELSEQVIAMLRKVRAEIDRLLERGQT